MPQSSALLSATLLARAAAADATLLFAGDTILNKHMLERGYDLMAPWEGVRQVIESTDAFLLNHEGSVTDITSVYNETESILSVPTGVAQSYLQPGIRPDFVALANNHQHDHGPHSYRHTLAFFNGHGIANAGIGSTMQEAAQPGWFNVSGRQVAVLATVLGPTAWDDPLILGQACDPVQCVAPSHGSAGVNFMNMTESTVATLRRRAQQARADGAWAVVMFFHWGCNWDWMDGTSGPTWLQRQQLARSLIDDGHVDLIWGSSAHHIQPIEFYKGVPIVYALGNLLVPIPPGVTPPTEYRTELAWLLKASFATSPEAPDARPQVRRLELVPVRSNDWNASALGWTQQDRQDREWLLTTYRKIAEPFGSHVHIEDDGSWVARPISIDDSLVV